MVGDIVVSRFEFNNTNDMHLSPLMGSNVAEFYKSLVQRQNGKC